MREKLISTLLELVGLNGPSRQERAVADFLALKFSALGFRVVEDDAAAVVDGNCGNLICYPPFFDSTKPAIFMVAHMDTVRPTAEAVPVVENGRITGKNDIALGIDNRAGVSILLHGAQKLVEDPSLKTNVVFVFTVCEEIGGRAAEILDLPENIKMGYVFDSSERPGTFIASTVGARLWDLCIYGKSAHAGIEPEKGINAIQIVGKIISRIPLGRISPDHTANIGVISGGSAFNVVPDRAEIHGETRASREEDLEDYIQQLEKVAQEECLKVGARFELRSRMAFYPYKVNKDSLGYTILVNALKSLKLPVNPVHYTGGSDANAFNRRGFSTINVGIGAQRPHAPDEFILIDDLESSYYIVVKILQLFAEVWRK